MNQPLQTVRGTHDLFGEEMRLYRHIVDTALRVAELYGFQEAAPPIFEFSEVFHRTLGETSDVVSKETYTFADRGGESLTLRPEFTASLARALISNKLTQSLPWKVFYAGPAFRYERPQKGRMRQFHQIGVECFGADSPVQDVEAIACGWRILTLLGLAEHATLEINSLGDEESRTAYRNALTAYLRQYQSALSAESQQRLEKNPLRVLDSKQEEDREIVAKAPEFTEFYSIKAKDWFAQVQEMLAGLQISYTVSPRLVRGLDYYTHTVFEVTTRHLGAQNTMLAGGRYDGLVRQLGGPDVPGVGWAAGVERLSLLVKEMGGQGAKACAPVVIIPVGEEQRQAAMKLCQGLREQEVVCEFVEKAGIGKSLKKADQLGAEIALLIGEEEVKHRTVTVKRLKTGEQETVSEQELYGIIRNR